MSILQVGSQRRNDNVYVSVRIPVTDEAFASVSVYRIGGLIVLQTGSGEFENMATAEPVEPYAQIDLDLSCLDDPAYLAAMRQLFVISVDDSVYQQLVALQRTAGATGNNMGVIISDALHEHLVDQMKAAIAATNSGSTPQEDELDPLG